MVEEVGRLQKELEERGDYFEWYLGVILKRRRRGK